MTNLSTLKKEARAQFRDRFIGNEKLDLLKPCNGIEIEIFCDILIEKVVEAAEESVKEVDALAVDDGTPEAQAYYEGIQAALNAFTNFKK